MRSPTPLWGYTSEASRLSSFQWAKQHIIKPNVHELERLMARQLKDIDAIADAAMGVYERGVEVVLVSMGEKGVLLVTKDERWIAHPPRVTVVNTIGAGDSAVAGFVHGLVLGENYKEAVMRAAATETAATLINDVSITQESVDAILAQVKVRRAT